MLKYYDGTKLLSLKDINGDKPELYLCTTNRSGGKTTYFGRLVVNRFLDKGDKFCLIYRYNYELDDCADKFFKDLSNLFFSNMKMISKKRGKGIYHELFLDEKSCGYAIALNNADQIKRMSHLMSDTKRMVFDEFQSESNHYCPNEVKKFISVHTSLARGNGQQCKYLPVYMLSNAVTLLNPYYVELGISNRINANTKFLRGEGFVLEHGFVETASTAQKNSAFNRAFSSNKYTQYSAQNVYLNDNMAFVEKLNGQSRYLCTIKYNSKEYGIREYPELGIVYCDDKPDSTYSIKITVTTEDHEINYIMLKNNDFIISNFKYLFEHGSFRFKNLSCKEAVLKMLSY